MNQTKAIPNKQTKRALQHCREEAKQTDSSRNRHAEELAERLINIEPRLSNISLQQYATALRFAADFEKQRTPENFDVEKFYDLVRQFPYFPTHPPPGTFYIKKKFKPNSQFWGQISRPQVNDTIPMYISRDLLPYLVPVKAFRSAHPNPPPHLQPDPIDMLAITNFLLQLEQLGI
ncbi:uncharacterized protein LOC105426679 [Pogonomyrmex barbatus]|uniref:Uncharacterized protein LOC105426679 n=1 Tax=Pogonomyrmex barbatus TaxID=144034 RepID=A0A6I9W7L0_9HYME|nr:uncharacterized protein LOC105426679 [Pogonomyrmex barbatus]